MRKIVFMVDLVDVFNVWIVYLSLYIIEILNIFSLKCWYGFMFFGFLKLYEVIFK